jgi:hypothetical protein
MKASLGRARFAVLALTVGGAALATLTARSVCHLTDRTEITVLDHTARWSLLRGNSPASSRWQATKQRCG